MFPSVKSDKLCWSWNRDECWWFLKISAIAILTENVPNVKVVVLRHRSYVFHIMKTI